MNPYEIDLAACRGRQRRLLEVMHERRLDAVIVTQQEHIQWLTGQRFAWLFSPVAAMHADGRVLLVAPAKTEPLGAIDDLRHFDAKWHSTQRNDQRTESSRVLLDALKTWPAVQHIGCEYSSFGPHLANGIEAQLHDVEPALYRLRRRKDADELAMIRKAIAGTERMYARAREIIRPGVTELEVFNELQSAAVTEFDEPLTGTGNDYQCGSRGGPPRAGRKALAGELYILDLGPAFRGYFADNARTIAVTEASEAQRTAWGYIMQVFEHVEREVRPGKNARELFQEAQTILDQAPVGVFNHHLGHGIGLFPHEAPHLNPHWDDTFEAGDVFTAEPGLYADELRAGMRIENDYLVTENGVERLTDFSLEL
ncbi:MAG: aminopeptidase P family protein [Planctomycetales bacterium]|nr:aminopeptidase P family protein [Planctomycetales bacterium]